MTQSPIQEYLSAAYDKTIQKLKQEQESKRTPFQELLTKSANQPTKK